jgi:hypothetical protein
MEYNIDNSGWTTYPASGALDLPEGKHDVEIRAMDKAGRVVTSTKSYWLDETIPDVALDPSGILGSNNWYTTDLTLAASATDNTSGMDIFEYSLDNTAWATYSTPLILSDGSHNVSFWAQDLAGLATQVDEIYNVDTRAPQIAGSLSGMPGTNGWYISDVTINTSAVDPAPGSGLETLTYILNGSSSTPYTDPITLPDGLHTIQFDAQDQAGLTDTMTQNVKVDSTAPLLNIETKLSYWSKSTIALNGTSSDSGSGLSKVEISTDSDPTWQTVNGTTSWS